MIEIKGRPQPIDVNDSNKLLITTQLTVEELLKNYSIDSEVNRDIGQERVRRLKKYIETYDTEIGIYFPSVILAASFKNMAEDLTVASHGNVPVLHFSDRATLTVIDGQHRIKALESFKRTCDDLERLTDVLNSTVTVQIYLGLTKDEQRSLFLDINSKSKKVPLGLAFQFDERDPFNRLIKDLLKEYSIFDVVKVSQKSSMRRPQNKEWISYTRFHRFLSFLLFDRMNPSPRTEKILVKNYVESKDFINRYFEVLTHAIPGEWGDVNEMVLGNEAVQNALAIASHRRFISYNSKDEIQFSPDWTDQVEALTLMDWSPGNSIFEDVMVQLKQYRGFKDNKHYETLPLLEKEWEENWALLQEEM